MLTADSYAKINLLLYNLGKRADGYHELYTIFYLIDLHDTITIRQSTATALRCNIPYIPVNSSNIILKVDAVLREGYGLKTHFDIELIKRIPVGGGLGGGSSNAATYLQMVIEHEGLAIDKAEQHKILAALGSDTAFFLYPPVAVGRGRGEVLTPVENFPKLHLVLVSPNIHISTAEVFSSKNLSLTTDEFINMMDVSKNQDTLIKCMRNDLESAVFPAYPLLKQICGDIEKAGAVKALMSGAGSSLFGVFKSIADRDRGYLWLKKEYKESLVVKL